MKTFLKIVLLSFVAGSCDPSYQVYIENDLNLEVLVKTMPSIETALGGEFPKHLRVSYSDSSSTYLFKPGEQILINAHIGFNPLPQYFPYESMQLITIADTVTLIGKNEILSRLTRIKSGRKYNMLFSNVFKN